MATLTPTGASGTGTETLTFNLGANDSGSTKTYSFKLRQTGSSETADTLTITQATSGVDVTSVEVVPGSVTINKGTSYDYQLEANVYPTNASDKRVTWSSDDSSEVAVGNTGWIRGVAVTSTAVGVHATSVADQSKSDYCLVTVVEAGSITVGSVNKLKNDTSAQVPITLSNIDTSRTISISVTSGTSWVTSIGSYDSSTSTVTLNISANLSTSSRSTTVTVTGYDLAGVQRTGYGTLSQNGEDNIQLQGITVSGSSSISDDGETEHLYNATYNPTDTSETGLSWDVVDASTGNSVVGTIVSIRSSGASCWVTALEDADNDSVIVKATSTVRPSISGTKAVTVTYVSVDADLQVSPDSVNVAWDATSNSSPVVTWNNTATPYIPTNGGWSGFITGASLNTTTGVITTQFSENTGSSWDGTVVVCAEPNGGGTLKTVTVNYTQAAKPDPTTYTNVSVGNLVVTSGARPTMSANVGFLNNDHYSYTFPSSFAWTLSGYNSSEDTTPAKTWTGSKDDYTSEVAAHSNVTVQLSHALTGTLEMCTYFVLSISIQGYTVIPATYTLSE